MSIIGFNFIHFFLHSIIVMDNFTSNDVYTLYNRHPQQLDSNFKL